MYDNDITTWSPMGRLHQIEYAQEAVKQGSATLGLRSDTHVVVAALLRKTKKLSGYQPKLFRVDDHLAVSIAGLTADARLLIKYMRMECLNNQYVFDSPLQVTSLVNDLADKAQTHTQDYSSRPYGVGLLVAGYDVRTVCVVCVCVECVMVLRVCYFLFFFCESDPSVVLRLSSPFPFPLSPFPSPSPFPFPFPSYGTGREWRGSGRCVWEW